MSGNITENAAGSQSSSSEMNPLWVVAGVLLATVLFFPLLVVAAVTVRVVARLGRLPVTTLTSFTGIFVALAAVTGVPNVVASLTAAFTTWRGVLAGDTTVMSAVDVVVTTGGVWSFTVGLMAGTAWVWWVRRSKPAWVAATVLRSAPWEWWRQRRTEQVITSGVGLPGGVTVGVNETSGERVTINDRAATGHTLCTGGTGAGKTINVLNQLVDAAAAGDPIVYVDLKGGPAVPEWLASLALKNGRRFQHFLIHEAGKEYVGSASEGPAFYDPAGYGDATRRKDLLTASSGSNVEYYRNQTADYVQIVFGVLEAHPEGYRGLSAIEAAMELMAPRVLQKRAREIPVAHPDGVRLKLESDKHAANRERDFENSLSTFRTYLSIFLNSTAGPWIAADSERGIDFRRVVDESGIVCFSLNASEYPELAGKLATVVIEDLTTLAGSMFGSNANGRVVRIVIDEFSAVGRANITNLIARGREAGFAVTLATQTLGDLRIQDPAFCDQLFGTVTNFLIHRANSEQDARLYSGLTGEVEYTRLGAQTLRVDGDLGASVLQQHVDYTIPWPQFTELVTGECFYINKNPQKVVKGGKKAQLEERVQRVRVIQREVMLGQMFSVPALGRASRYSGVNIDAPVTVEPAAELGVWNLGEPELGEPSQLGTTGVTFGFESFASLVPYEAPVDKAPVENDKEFIFDVLTGTGLGGVTPTPETPNMEPTVKDTVPLENKNTGEVPPPPRRRAR